MPFVTKTGTKTSLAGCYAPISRSLAKQLIIEQEFRHHRVQIEYVMGEYPDTPEGGLNKNIKAVIAEYERVKINERMVEAVVKR